jgi:hypothetical protein
MPQQSYHHQQYGKIRISYSFKDSTVKGLNASEKLQHIPKGRSQRKKLGHKIINVTYPDKHRLVGHLTFLLCQGFFQAFIQQGWQSHHIWWHRIQAVFQSNNKVG